MTLLRLPLLPEEVMEGKETVGGGIVTKEAKKCTPSLGVVWIIERSRHDIPNTSQQGSCGAA